MDSCFVLIGTRQHGVANLNDANYNVSANKLHNDPFTISSSVPWTLLPPETRAATPRVPESKASKQCLAKSTFHVVSALHLFYFGTFEVPMGILINQRSHS